MMSQVVVLLALVVGFFDDKLTVQQTIVLSAAMLCVTAVAVVEHMYEDDEK